MSHWILGGSSDAELTGHRVAQNEPHGNGCRVAQNEPRTTSCTDVDGNWEDHRVHDHCGRDGSQLFIHLILKLRHFADACVLWVLLKERADVKEVTTTSMLMSHVQLAGLIDRNAAKRAFHSLQQLGLIRVRVHRKTATLVMVDRPAVLQLLTGALDDRLPGLSGKAFPFLSAWSAELPAEKRVLAAEAPARERHGASELGGNPQTTSTASGRQADALSPPST